MPKQEDYIAGSDRAPDGELITVVGRPVARKEPVMSLYAWVVASFQTLLVLSALQNADARRRKNCFDKALEAREEQANVVFTGTVKSIFPDRQHPNMYKGEVEIKRIFKGDNVVYQLPLHLLHNKKMVMVDGFGDPHICESEIRKYDTRIFLANMGKNGELRLNSSLVRMTLNNLDHADAAVQGKWIFRLRTREQ